LSSASTSGFDRRRAGAVAAGPGGRHHADPA